MYTMQFLKGSTTANENLKHYNHQPLAHYGLPDCCTNQDYADPGADLPLRCSQWVNQAQFAGFYVAADKGYYKEGKYSILFFSPGVQGSTSWAQSQRAGPIWIIGAEESSCPG